jgi:hypothetical protein
MASAQDKAPLKLAMIVPIEPWDRRESIDALRKWLEANYRIEVIWVEPAKPQPSKDATAEERKAYYANPPELKNLAEAEQADVVYTALTHVSLNEKDSAAYLKLLTGKPLVAGRRSHHSISFRLPKGFELPGLVTGKFGESVIGGEYKGHHGGGLRFKEGQADHPIVKGLPELAKISLTDRGYRHAIADDTKVLIESVEGQPQTWVYTNKATKLKVFYTVHDPRDFEKHEAVRQMMARALFWVSDRDEASYKKS